jgi:hypothetical protein
MVSRIVLAHRLYILVISTIRTMYPTHQSFLTFSIVKVKGKVFPLQARL